MKNYKVIIIIIFFILLMILEFILLGGLESLLALMNNIKVNVENLINWVWGIING